MEAITKTFNGTPLDFTRNDAGDICLSAEQLGQALGYADPRPSVLRIIARNEDEFEGLTCVVKMTTEAGDRETTVIAEEGIYLVGMKASTKQAKAFRKWVTQVLRELRKGAVSLTTPSDPLSRMADYVMAIDGTREKQIQAAQSTADEAKQLAEEAKALAAANVTDTEKVTQDAANILRWEQARASKLRPKLEAMCKRYGELREANDYGPKVRETITLNRTLKTTYGKRDMLTMTQLERAIGFVQSLIDDMPDPERGMEIAP